MKDHVADILPCDDNQPRPTWSVLVPCYNCADFLGQALESVLMQDPGPERMEILVIDDCSDLDDPKQVVDAVGRGRVRFMRQTANVGKVRNYETGLQASRGHLIHQLHGDDRVVDGFYRGMEAAFTAFPAAGAFFCESDYIDENGKVTGRTGRERERTGMLADWLPRLVEAQRIQTPAMVVKREVYETLGGFDRRLDCSEDWEMWVRIANRFPVGFCAEARAQYRYSANNNSARSILNGTRGAIQRRMFEIVDSYLPAEVVTRVSGVRAREQALFFAGQVPKVMRAGGVRGWMQLGRQVLGFSREPFVIRRFLSLTLRVLGGKL
jgi:glycosyltransferase involved in cell wall biosynthesis